MLHPAKDTHLAFAVRTVVENILQAINTEWNQTTAKPTTTGKTKTKMNTFLFSLQAGSLRSTSKQGVATSATSSSNATRQDSEPALISANFSFPPQKQQKIISQLIFTASMNFGGSIGKIVNLFHSNMQARYLLLIKFCQRNTVKVYV